MYNMMQHYHLHVCCFAHALNRLFAALPFTRLLCMQPQSFDSVENLDAVREIINAASVLRFLAKVKNHL